MSTTILRCFDIVRGLAICHGGKHYFSERYVSKTLVKIFITYLKATRKWQIQNCCLSSCSREIKDFKTTWTPTIRLEVDLCRDRPLTRYILTIKATLFTSCHLTNYNLCAMMVNSSGTHFSSVHPKGFNSQFTYQLNIPGLSTKLMLNF